MSTTSSADDPHQMTNSPAFIHILTHVFLPVQLPDENDNTPENNYLLARAVCAAARAYGTHVPGTSEQPQWNHITKMLDNLQASVQSNGYVISQLRGMQTGGTFAGSPHVPGIADNLLDILAFFIRCQNVAIILTKRECCTLCEAFQVSPSEDAVEKTPEPLICSYPGSAVETPNELFDDVEFQFELANFLSRPNAVDSDLALLPPTDPQYINALLNEICRAADVSPVTKRTAPFTNNWCGGHTAHGSRINKRVRDHVGPSWRFGSKVKDIWRRSPLWLLIRVAIQMTVNRSLGRASYKRFMLFFTCTLARDERNTSLSSDLLHLMLSKTFRRSTKLGSSTPHRLSEMALKTCTCLREILDARWEQLSARSSPFRNPSQDELSRDTQLSLLNSGGYIRNALMNPDPQLLGTPFHPSHRRRGSLEDFLSLNGTFFDEAYTADPDVTLYDVERSVEEGIDDWLACVTDVDEACAQLDTLMDKYLPKASSANENPESVSIMLLTWIELYVALDKLVVKQIPMLADYSLEFPIACLERLFLRKATSLHRLSCAYQYLSVRHSRSRPGWSLLSNEFTKDSFPVRYYDQSPHLQQLKVRIEQNATENIAGRPGPRLEGASLAQTYYDGYQQILPRRRLAEWAPSPLPALPLHAKVVIFELQCPACIRIWRSAAPHILRCFKDFNFWCKRLDVKKGHHLLEDVPALRPYFVESQGPPPRVQIHLAYVYPEGIQSRNGPLLRYVVHHPKSNDAEALLMWNPIEELDKDRLLSRNLIGQFSCYHGCPSCKDLKTFVDNTSRTSNDVLSAQAACPADLSLDEFVAFAHLRSGGSLQWLNILQGLRSRTLNLRRHAVHFLLAHAALEVGPLDLNTGTWAWHQELQDSCFCNALLDELDSLFVDATGLIDGMLMNTISLLLTRVLASSPSKGVSGRAIALLRSIRKVTFSWVQELSYDLAQAPTNEERRNFLLDMAATCRSTFDVDRVTLRKVFHSAEDVDALLSCGFFIHTLRADCMSNS